MKIKTETKRANVNSSAFFTFLLVRILYSELRVDHIHPPYSQIHSFSLLNNFVSPYVFVFSPTKFNVCCPCSHKFMTLYYFFLLRAVLNGLLMTQHYSHRSVPITTLMGEELERQLMHRHITDKIHRFKGLQNAQP